MTLSRPGGRWLMGSACVVLGLGCGRDTGAADGDGSESVGSTAGVVHENVILDLWAEGTTAFGVYVPNERPRQEGGQGRRPQGPRQPPIYTVEGGERLARNPLYDFVFLNLEGSYDEGAVEAMAAGLRSPSAVGHKALLVRIPPISADGEEATRTRIRTIFALGADGVVLPHVRSVEEAELAIGMFADAGVDVWSPSNPSGESIGMIMLEDPDAVAQAAEIAQLPGYSVLACGIGSLTGALDGDREAAERWNQEILALSKSAGLADMITANANNVEQRVQEGFLALLMQGPTADDVIRTGRTAAGRD